MIFLTHTVARRATECPVDTEGVKKLRLWKIWAMHGETRYVHRHPEN